MTTESSAPERAFAEALRSFQTGGVKYTDFIAEVKRQLAAGASPTLLQEFLRRRESVEPLPPYAHDEVTTLLANPALRAAGVPEAQPAASPPAPLEPVTIVLDEVDGGPQPPGDGPQDPGTPSVGDILAGRFRLVELIGEGGMSRVYKATDAEPEPAYAAEPYIAVKVLRRAFSLPSAAFAELPGELRRLAMLTHPNIVRMYDCGREASWVFMTMEYLAGVSLYSRLHGRTTGAPIPRLHPAEAAAILAAIAAALDYAHRQGIVHGDLKPGNVILTERGGVKVIDFGIAGWMARPAGDAERHEAAQSRAATLLTPRYASPQLLARQKPQISDDVYALACLAYELLTGIHPFGDADANSTGEFPPPRRVPLTPRQYATIVAGLEREHRQRTPTVRQFMENLAGSERESRRRGGRFTWTLWTVVAGLVVAGVWFLGHHGLDIGAPPAPRTAVVPGATPVPAPALAPDAAEVPGTVLRDCPTCPLMTVVPAGRFLQGAAGAGASSFERPRHEVIIDYPFAMSANAVTVGDFREFAVATSREMRGCDTYDGEWRHRPKAGWQNPGFAQSPLHPVTCVSWNDAAAYALWLSARTGHRYRLPSAAEWEYAARAGGTTASPWDGREAAACAHANVADQSAARRYPGWQVFACDDGYANTAPVGTFKANAFGLNDMLGNVFQWTQDCWHADYGSAPGDGSARQVPDCVERELRGGSWFTAPAYVRASYRNHFASDYRTSSVGFRLVREMQP